MTDRGVCPSCFPLAPVKPVSGWQCPVCRRVFAPFVPQCSFCKPRRNYEVLDPHIPRDTTTTTLRHGMTVPLGPAVFCERCGNPCTLQFQTETGCVCERCTTTRRSGDSDAE
jgi:hypothetical protein